MTQLHDSDLRYNVDMEIASMLICMLKILVIFYSILFHYQGTVFICEFWTGLKD